MVRCGVAALCGAIIGLERELKQKPAGFRTNILICVGAAIYMCSGLLLINAGGMTGDPGRIAAQVVTGIGFLGAGAIMRTNSGIQGLTTAATIWVNAAIGVAAGGGEYHLAVIATVVTLVVLLVLQPIEKYLDHRHSQRGKAPTDA